MLTSRPPRRVAPPSTTAPPEDEPQAQPVIELNSANFDQEVLQAEGLVIIDAWGFFCEPCDELKPIFREVATEYAGQAKFCSLNLDLAEDIADRYSLRIRPTLIMFVGGQESMVDISKIRSNFLG